METGRIPSDNDRLIAIQTWIRLLQNQAAENAGIQPQPDQLLASIRNNPLFLKDGAYDPELFQRFSANFLSPQGFTGERFNEAIFDEVRTRQLLGALSSTVAVFPGEAEVRLDRLFGPVEAQVLRWEAAKLTPPEPSPQDLESFHKNNEQAFAVSAQATVEFVEFTAAGTDEEARKKAGEAAFAFTSQFFNLTEGKTPPDFNAKAAEAKLSVKSTGLFTAADTPFPGDTDPRLTAAALRLSPDEPVSDFLPSKNGFLVLSLKEFHPGRVRPLAEIKAEVKDRWRQQARLQLASKNALLFLDRANL
ncbi:MAG: peptidyl-prolyl cis-trans isomerase, partial [Verrucomicrobiota bacterium]